MVLRNLGSMNKFATYGKELLFQARLARCECIRVASAQFEVMGIPPNLRCG